MINSTEYLYYILIFYIFNITISVVALDEKLHGASLFAVMLPYGICGVTAALVYAVPVYLCGVIPCPTAFVLGTLGAFATQTMLYRLGLGTDALRIIPAMLISSIVAAFLALGTFHIMHAYVQLIQSRIGG